MIREAIVDEAKELAVGIESAMRVLGKYHHRSMGLFRSKLGNWMEHGLLLVWAMPYVHYPPISQYEVTYDGEEVFHFHFYHEKSEPISIRLLKEGVWMGVARVLIEKAKAVKLRNV